MFNTQKIDIETGYNILFGCVDIGNTDIYDIEVEYQMLFGWLK
jgi:hypothetical protein